MGLGGIPTPAFFTAASLRAGVAVPPGRYIVKSVWEHASIGIDGNSVVTVAGAEELKSRIAELGVRLGGDCFAESYIEGREFNLAVVSAANGEPQVLPPAEIVFTDYPPDKLKIVDYSAKWDEDSYEYDHTNRVFDFPPADVPLLKQMQDIARRCWDLFELGGFARVDFRLDEQGQPWVLEVNANPCIVPECGFAKACERAGISYVEAIRLIVDAAHR